MLSQQAFWLCLFEYLEKHKEAVSGVKFRFECNFRTDGVADLMLPVPIEGADAAKIAKAIKASQGAFSKTRGKIPSLAAWGLINMAKHALPADGVASLERKEQIFKNALGGELYGLRLSIVESKEIDSVVASSMAQALGARSKRL